MFPEAFVGKWLRRLTKPGDYVLDPFSGRGTTALTALLAGRGAIACDVNEVAFCLTAAKTNPPPFDELAARIVELEADCCASFHGSEMQLSEFFDVCFHPNTLRQILYLRSTLNWRNNRTDRMIAALVLGSLHGDSGANSPYLSNQMPRTISMNPDYSVRFWAERKLIAPERDLFALIRDRSKFRYESPLPTGRALIFHTDMRGLKVQRRKWPKIKCVITSPPYLNVTSFEEDQWLRLWFLGAPSVPSKGRISKDDRHVNTDAYWKFIGDMWATLSSMVEEEAHVVIRIGSRTMESHVMKQGLVESALNNGVPLRLVSSRVTELRRRQTGSFMPGSAGCRTELDCHFQFKK